MKVAVIPVTPFQQNCSLLICEETRRAAVVDPGGDLDEIGRALESQQATLERIFITHGHLDHCGAAAALRARTGVPIEGPHVADRFWIDQLPESAARYQFPSCEVFEPDRWLVHGDIVRFGAEQLAVLHCPGHTPGHVVFFHAPHRLAFVGDVLFQGSVGRTDFPRGDHLALVQSIRGALWPLGDDVAFVPGHGPMSTFGDERRNNPFVGDDVKKWGLYNDNN